MANSYSRMPRTIRTLLLVPRGKQWQTHTAVCQEQSGPYSWFPEESNGKLIQPYAKNNQDPTPGSPRKAMANSYSCMPRTIRTLLLVPRCLDFTLR
ncbi:hypothetical protein PoB_002699500 [Plakobranchus ocellatus]|uniref:Uncharacterized protein n=1 Tax=Plakobranchus ocellatus TaxID=259542 RepID=A0AAV3ZX96_9GAST|nr:hypothetical protein PoB_002699500 [Plakobranchus ocellatus]